MVATVAMVSTQHNTPDTDLCESTPSVEQPVMEKRTEWQHTDSNMASDAQYGPGEDGSRSSASDCHALLAAQLTAAYEAARTTADTRRRNAHVKYLAARDAWQNWRDKYRHLWLQHQFGIDPGFGPSWDPAWIRKQFVIQHLAQARRLTTRALKREQLLCTALELGKLVDLEPLPWQDSYFPSDPYYYAESQENALVESAPRDVIRDWLRRLPDAPTDFAGHATVEYPNNMDYSVTKDIEPWESESCVPEKYTKQRIRKTQPAEPPSFTQPLERVEQRKYDSGYQSHWF